MTDGKIPQSDIDRARYDIASVVSARIDLKKAGKNLSACCPFHNEKSPSFSVSPEKGFYYCFGCGANGDAIEFVMAYEGLDFRNAVAAINGDLPSTLTHAKVQAHINADRSVKPSNHCEDPAKSQSILGRCTTTDNHMYLLSNNTAPFQSALNFKGALIVELFNLAGELVNLAAIRDGEIRYVAGGISYGAVAVLNPAHEPDGATILCVDYAEAWRLWWLMKGKTKIICAMEFENAKWIADKQRVRFTHVGCSAEYEQHFYDYGHDVILIPDPYAAKVAS